MRFVITEEEKKLIQNLYLGLLSEQQNYEVKIEGREPLHTNTDWDMVHAFFGSKRLSDDLEQRVSDELSKGSYVVDNVVISIEKKGNSIITKGSVFLRNTKQGEIPDKYFTTRGSIGPINSDYKDRHDTQINGLEDRLKQFYKSGGVKKFGPFDLVISDTGYGCKQSFFAVKEGSQGSGEKKTVQGSDLNDLREKMKSLTNLSIDPTSFIVDFSKNKIDFKLGDVAVKSLSFIWDNQGQLNSRLSEILRKNTTMVVAKKGTANDMEWAVLYFK